MRKKSLYTNSYMNVTKNYITKSIQGLFTKKLQN